MNQCKVPNCENTSLVYSGVDAFMLGGIPTETYCYACALTRMPSSKTEWIQLAS
jgi:hypothetical protein